MTPLRHITDPSVWLEDTHNQIQVTVSIREFPDGRGYAFIGVGCQQSTWAGVLSCGQTDEEDDGESSFCPHCGVAEGELHAQWCQTQDFDEEGAD